MKAAGKAWLAAALLASAVPALQSEATDWGMFLPHSLENHAWVETFASWENENVSGTARGTDWNDTFIREKLSVESEGYSYDPRFLRYRLTLAGAAKQED